MLVNLHTHDMFEMLYFVRGEASYYVNGKSYTLRPHDLILTRPAHPHQIFLNDEVPYERYLLQFTEHTAPSSLLQALPADKDIINMSEVPLLNAQFLRIDTYCDKLDTAILHSLFPSLICEVLSNFVIEDQPSTAQHLTVHPTLERALTYIDNNLTRVISIEEMCRELYVTRGHLHHLFLTHLQTTPKRYITEKRLFRAKRELRQGKPPTSVYQECGFADYTSFYRNYRTFFGYPPSKEQTVGPGHNIIS
ncbi:MAG: helix-turn-helix domain-containing protein [Clostridia bacterium]|nr:helix-turn-helix domain-containing protein [Clostridia bacterium]